MTDIMTLLNHLPTLAMPLFSTGKCIGELYYSNTEGAGIRIFGLCVMLTLALLMCKVLIPWIVIKAGIQGTVAMALKFGMIGAVGLSCDWLRVRIVRSGKIP